MRHGFWTLFHILLAAKGLLCLLIAATGRFVLIELCSLLVILAALGLGYILYRQPCLMNDDPQAASFRRRIVAAGVSVLVAMHILDLVFVILAPNSRAYQLIRNLPLGFVSLSIIWDLMKFAGLDKSFRLSGTAD